MRLHPTLLALFAVPVLAQEIKDEAVKSPEGSIARGERDAPAVSVRLREAGVLQVKVGDAWKDTTLKDFSTLLKTSAGDYDREMRKGNKSGYEAYGSVKLPRLFVSIDAEPTVPWQHIRWLMTIAAEQKYRKFELCDGQRTLLVSLPVDRSINGQPAEPPLELKVSVHVVVRAEKEGRWGDLAVSRPVDVRFRIGSEETADLANVTDFVKKAWTAVKDTPNARISGEIKAGNKAPFSTILDAMETFEAAGFPRVDFYGAGLPPATVREAARLPYPLRNYDDVD